jgi:perosamine synthetase
MTQTVLPFHVPEIGEEEVRAVVDTLESRWLTTGPRVERFEADFARYLGAAHAVAVNSCTAALHVALEAVGVHEGDEVLVPAMTFAATSAVVLHLKATPVLLDCDPTTLNLDPAELARRASPRSKAIVPVHLAGGSCAMDAILEFARPRGIRIVEDAAHALPATYRGKAIGRIGDITCFSFYATKTITTGEGGMATTDSDEYAARMRVMSLHGISKDAWKRYTAEGSWFYEVVAPGFKYNMPDLEAAIGIEQLKKCERFWQARQRLAARYTAGLADLDTLECPVTPSDGQHAWHLYVVKLNLERLRITRDEFIRRLKARGIATSVHFIPLHLHPYYRDTLGYRPDDFPNATAAYRRIVSLPLYPGLSDEDVARVVDEVRSILNGCRR